MPKKYKFPAEKYFDGDSVMLDRKTLRTYLTDLLKDVETSEVIFTGELHYSETASIKMNDCERVRIYAICNGMDTVVFELDLKRTVPKVQVSGYPYQCVGVSGASDSPIRHWKWNCIVNEAKTAFKVQKVTFHDGGGSSADWNNINTYVYKIEGIRKL